MSRAVCWAFVALAACLATWGLGATAAQDAGGNAAGPGIDGSAVLSQPAVPEPDQPPAEDEEPPPVSQETKQQAKRHFLKGIKLLREQAWAPALAEFLLSRELYATRVATNNAAIALRKLQRYDEALDMFETLLRDFKVPPAERSRVAAPRSVERTLMTIAPKNAHPKPSTWNPGTRVARSPPATIGTSGV